MQKPFLFFLLLALALSLASTWGEVDVFEPYKVLGVHRRASTQDIRKAYKKLAKEWHPDKAVGNGKEQPEAEAKFIQINRAYELLNDPERRRRYDNHGVTEDAPNFSKSNKDHVYSSYGRFDHPFDSFQDFFGAFGGGGGGTSGGGPRIFHKQTVTSKAYYGTVLPNSASKPYLMLFYSDWCFTCLRVEPIWTKLAEELEPVGFGIATVHTEHEKELARKISVKELPHMVLLLDGKPIHYKDPQFSAVKAIEFVRRKMPYKLVEFIDDGNVDAFLNGWMDNKIRVLFFGKIDVIRLRYLTTAFMYRKRAAFGYVNVKNSRIQVIVDRFGINNQVDTVLLFHEDVDRPVASITMQSIPLSTLHDVMKANQFLRLPRLSSQSVLDALCPPEASKVRRRLCVLLINNDDDDDGYGTRQTLRDFVSDHRFGDRVKFVYVWQNKQADFVNELKASGSSSNAVEAPNLVIVWRKESRTVRYEWFGTRWPSDPLDAKLNGTRETLRRTLQGFLTLTSDLDLAHEARIIDELFDEHTTSVLVRISNSILDAIETIRENVTKDELLPALSLVVTLGLVLCGGYVMNYLVKMEEESVRKQLGSKGLKVDRKNGKVVPELKIHELRAETYNGMVRLLKPGCRTLVLIVDHESKEKLVPKFYKLAWPYRRNKTLMFGFLYIEKGLPWFKKILNLTLPAEQPRRDLVHINPKNCIGTVLSLNGHRRYFCMYHAKHPEGSRRKLYTVNNGATAGAFMGFDSEEEDGGSSDGERDVEGGGERPKLWEASDHLPIFEDQLLDGLQLWMDRLFEGSTYRYHINYWPEFPISPATTFATKPST